MLELVCSRPISRCSLQPYIVLKCKAMDERTATEKTVCDYHFVRRHQGGSRGRERQRGMGKDLPSGLRGKEWARQGKLI